ncbi:uncharacterized protein LOC124128265 [Haliotis rufescens]|uniref:uncharacterized protein LOC124128265 n=1 Tax=Haliotis rufescens TaxID=6454 RepID=UPI00201F8994|nr:uncharacterized protein LOC124128265 [Haliotis rufescens]
MTSRSASPRIKAMTSRSASPWIKTMTSRSASPRIKTMTSRSASPRIKAMTSRSASQSQVYVRQSTGAPDRVVDISVGGAGSVYLPCFSSPPRFLRSKSAFKFSIDGASPNLLTPADRRKPDLLTSVVYEGEVADIVNRLRRPTISTKRKTVKLYPNLGYVDMNFYSWKNMQLYSDYQRTIFNENGAVKPSFRRCGQRNSWM